QGQRRVYRPWVAEPGMWFQWDWAKRPGIGERGTSLFCAWLAWSRYRVILPTWDRTYPTLVACLDQMLRAFGGVPPCGLTDNEKTVTGSSTWPASPSGIRTSWPWRGIMASPS